MVFRPAVAREQLNYYECDRAGGARALSDIAGIRKDQATYGLATEWLLVIVGVTGCPD